MRQQNLKLLIVISLLTISFVATADGPTRNFSANIEASSGYNSNVFSSGKDELYDAAMVASVSDFQHSLILNGGYKYFDGKNSDAKLYVDYYYDRLQSNEINYSTLDISLPYSYYTENFRFRFVPLISSFKSDGVGVMQYYGGSINITRKFGFYRAGINSLFIKNKVIDSNYSMYAGSSINNYIFLEKQSYSSQASFKLGIANYQYQQTIEGDESYTSYYFGSSYMIFKGRKEIAVTGKIQSKKYITDPFDAFERADYTAKLTITPAYRLTKSIKLFAKAQYAINNSNLVTDTEDYSYDQTQLNIGLSWRL